MTIMKQKYVSYSDQLSRLIESILESHDDEQSFLFKAQMGMVAWNYCLAQEHEMLPFPKIAATDAFEKASQQGRLWKTPNRGSSLLREPLQNQPTPKVLHPDLGRVVVSIAAMHSPMSSKSITIAFKRWNPQDFRKLRRKVRSFISL